MSAATPRPTALAAVAPDDPRALGRVAVLMGGASAEREVSIMSGTGVLAALRSRGVDAFAFDPAERGLHELREWKANLTLAPSEFSAVRLEVFRAEAVDDDYEDLGAALQVNFTIGSHPAHAY